MKTFTLKRLHFFINHFTYYEAHCKRVNNKNYDVRKMILWINEVYTLLRVLLGSFTIILSKWNL